MSEYGFVPMFSACLPLTCSVKKLNMLCDCAVVLFKAAMNTVKTICFRLSGKSRLLRQLFQSLFAGHAVLQRL